MNYTRLFMFEELLHSMTYLSFFSPFSNYVFTAEAKYSFPVPQIFFIPLCCPLVSLTDKTVAGTRVWSGSSGSGTIPTMVGTIWESVRSRTAGSIKAVLEDAGFSEGVAAEPELSKQAHETSAPSLPNISPTVPRNHSI